MSKFKIRANWRYALGEILLIFIGISLAVAFDNWNQNRNEANIQALILDEIKSDLNQDTVLLNRAILRTENLMLNIDFMVNHLEEKKPYSDTVSQALSKVLNFPRISFISAGYQTLKATDITLIDNQSLRRNIVEYYEYMHPTLQQLMGDVEFEFKTYWTPWILDNILEFRYGQTAIPLEYNSLLNDLFLIRNLKISKDNNTGLYRWLLNTKKEAQELIGELDNELE